VIPLNSVAFALLAALPQEGAVLFPAMPRQVSTLFPRYVKKAGLPSDITFHCLRDTYILCLAPYCTTPTLMALAPHRAYSTTRRYVQGDGAHLRHAVESLVSETGAGTVTPIVSANLEPL
jgi:hypothetical protein